MTYLKLPARQRSNTSTKLSLEKKIQPNPAQKLTRPSVGLPQVKPTINIPALKTEGVFPPAYFLIPPPHILVLLWNLPAHSAFGRDPTLTSDPGLFQLSTDIL